MTARSLVPLFAALLPVAMLAASDPKKPQVRINLDEPAKPARSDAPAPAWARPKTPEEKAKAQAAAEAAAKAEAAKAAAAKPPVVEELPAEVAGLEIARPGDLGFLGLELVENRFRIGFYDLERKPVTPDATGIVLRWPVRYQPLPERAFLTAAADGKSMTSEKVVRAPHAFRLHITLLKTAADGSQIADEDYDIDFAAEPPSQR